MNEPRDAILAAIRHATAGLDESADESSFQAALASELPPSERELRAVFAPALLPPRRPPESAISDLATRTPSRHLPAEGRDPCASQAKLDILWHSPYGAIPIELKFCPKWKADTNGYQFLKDLHRLERLTAVGRHAKLADHRYAAFATREPVYWTGGRPEPQPFWLTHGRRTEAGYWVQYDQKSPDTLWFSYPPFHLAHSYEFGWHDLHADWKCLLVEVKPQQLSRV